MAPAMNTRRNGPSQDGEGPRGRSAASAPLGPRSVPCPLGSGRKLLPGQLGWPRHGRPFGGVSSPALQVQPGQGSWTQVPGDQDRRNFWQKGQLLLRRRGSEPVNIKQALETGPAAGSSRPAHRQVGSMPVIGCFSCQARCQGLVPGPHHLEHILYI